MHNKTAVIFWPEGDEVSTFETGKEKNYNGHTAIVRNIITYDNVVEIMFDDDSEIKICGIPFEYHEIRDKK
jgi:hypothetical protein